MALLYGDILRATRDASVWFDPSRIPGGVAARLASGVQRDLVVLASRRDPERYATTQTITAATVIASLGTPPSPVTLTDSIVYVRAQTVITGSVDQPTELRMLTPDRLSSWNGRGWYVSGPKAYFTGIASDWANVTSVLVTYVPFPADFAAETDAVTLFPAALNCFIDGLVLQFALRLNGMPTNPEDAAGSAPIRVDVNAFQKSYDDSLAQMLSQLGQQRRQSRLTIRNGADFT